MTTDAELLRRYAEDRSESAFGELVQRHLGLVYSAALRRTNGNRHLAEEIAQQVFTSLARKSAALKSHPTLVGWLYQTTRYSTIDALRAEKRRQSLAESLQAMSDESSQPEPRFDWEILRPALDEAMDHLKERDRELMLLRFFHGLTFAEVGQRLQLSENAARMRSERALEKLRARLGRRGITSTSAALSTLLASHAAASVPVDLAATVTSAALASGPATGLAGLGTILLMSKFTAPIASAVVAAALTAIVCTSTAHDFGPETAALRQENLRLKQSTQPGASPEALAETASAYTAKAIAVAQAFSSPHDASSTINSTTTNPSRFPETSPRGYKSLGNATPREAAMTFAYICDIADPALMAKIIWFDDTTRAEALKVLATMPESIRTQYPTPEAFYGLCIAAGCIEAPPPRAELAEMFGVVVETGPGRFATRRRGSDRNMHEYQHTADGWKYILPKGAIAGAPGALNSATLQKVANRR